MTSTNNKTKLINYANINFDKIEYSIPYKSDTGYYTSLCTYRIANNIVIPLLIETPRLKSSNTIIKADGDKLYVDLEIPIDSEFYDFINKFDTNNINNCQDNSKEWFGRNIPLTVIENYYKPSMIIRNSGKNYILRANIPIYKGNIACEFFNINRELVSSTYLSPGDDVICIIEISNMKFYSKSFICEWEVKKMKILKNIENKPTIINSGYIFSDSNTNITPSTPNNSNIIKQLPIQSKIIQSTQQIIKNNDGDNNDSENNDGENNNFNINVSGISIKDIIKNNTLNNLIFNIPVVSTLKNSINTDNKNNIKQEVSKTPSEPEIINLSDNDLEELVKLMDSEDSGEDICDYTDSEITDSIEENNIYNLNLANTNQNNQQYENDIYDNNDYNECNELTGDDLGDDLNDDLDDNLGANLGDDLGDNLGDDLNNDLGDNNIIGFDELKIGENEIDEEYDEYDSEFEIEDSDLMDLELV